MYDYIQAANFSENSELSAYKISKFYGKDGHSSLLGGMNINTWQTLKEPTFSAPSPFCSLF